MPAVYPTARLKDKKKAKRRCLNERLAKLVMPKNPVMVLYELKDNVKFTTLPQPQVQNKPSFVVRVEFDGKFFIGRGITKALAKQSAAEQAVKGLLIANIMAVTSLADDTASVDSADELPWGQLASMAMYKLFVDWNKIAYPRPRPGVKHGVKHKPMKRRPMNPHLRDPVMLLSQMRPCTKYTEIARVGNAPNLTFTMGTLVEGVTYTGIARNKRDAKKIAARAVLEKKYHVRYDT